jgi:pimeloyl-ACP methyl ester carboxylesterase
MLAPTHAAAKGILMTTSTDLPIAEGMGSVLGVPELPDGFVETFTSRYIDVGDLRLHAVIGGDGPPLLLIHGWPQTWFYWRLVMPTLAKDFEVIAVDQRGIGLSGKPETGYDTASLAEDMTALMDALGHERFAVVGVDTGMLIAYAVAADHRDRVQRLVVGEAPLPGISPALPLILPPGIVERLYHIPFNQTVKTNELLVAGREDIYFGAELDASAGTQKLPAHAIDHYVEMLSNPEALHGSFQMYRSFATSAEQNEERVKMPLTVPVLAIGGEESSGGGVEQTMKLAAENVTGRIIPGVGHWLAEQAPDEILEALTQFLAPYRQAATADG